jgi:hypothetical protein
MRLASLLSVAVVAAAVVLAFASDPAQEPPTSGLITMYLRDPIGSSLSFRTGSSGRAFQDHMLKNFNSDLDVGLQRGDFMAGVEGGRVAGLVDFGTPQELREKYGYAETWALGQGFASIRMVEGRLAILADYSKQTTQPMTGTEPLFGALKSSVRVPIVDDHVYVMRLLDTNDPAFEVLVKFLVVGYVPDQSVTIRWERIGRG